MLVGLAVPFNCCELSESNESNDSEYDEEQIDELEDNDKLEEIQEIYQNEGEHQEEIDNYSSNSILEQITIDDDDSPETEPQRIICDRTATNIDRKIVRIKKLPHNGSGQPPKLMKLDVNQCQQRNGSDATITQYRKGRNSMFLITFLLDLLA